MHDKILFIRKHLQYQNHPISLIIEEFKVVYIPANMGMLIKKFEPGSTVNIQVKLKHVLNSVIQQAWVFVEALVQFYDLLEYVGDQTDLRRELLFNLVTNMLMTGDMYFLVHNLISLSV